MRTLPPMKKHSSKLDLLVTAELAMTETAALSHYVLPSRSGYESWDGTFFPMTYPGIYLPDAPADCRTGGRAERTG